MTGIFIVIILLVVVGYPLLSPLWRKPEPFYFHSESGARP